MRAVLLAGALVVALAGASNAQDARENKLLVVRAGSVHVGDGRVLDDVRILVRDGKIVEIEPDEEPAPKDGRVLDLRRKTLIPGLIAAHSELSAVDRPANLTPDEVAAESFDFYEKWPKLLASGLTTVYLSPGKRRLVPGIGSVVKLAGSDPASRMLSERSALRINLSPGARRSIPSIFEPGPAPTADDPLRPSRRQRGSSRTSQLEVLARAFEEARTTQGDYGGEGKQENRYLVAPLREAAAGTLPVRLAAPMGADIWHGVAFLSKLGATTILERPIEVLPLKEELGREVRPVVLAMPVRPAAMNPGDYEEQERSLASPEVAGQLAERGVPVSLVPSSDADLDKLRILAGLACRFGLPESKALAAITLEAARCLGVAARVGSIEKGKDADFVALSGGPFDARSQVDLVLVDGKTVYERSEARETFALRAGHVLIGDGRVLAKATVIVKNGRIDDVGVDIPLPPGAELIDAPDSFLVPGYIAAATKLGLHGDSGSRIRAATDIDVAAALEYEDPALRTALEAGITTLFVTPDGSGTVGARVAAIKTHGEEDGFVLRPIAGLGMTLTRGGKTGSAQLLAAIKKARAYIDPPKPKKGAAKKPEPKKPEVDAGEDAAPADTISGAWKGTMTGGPLPRPIPFSAEMTLEGKKLTAKMSGAFFRNGLDLAGSYENDAFTLTGQSPIGGGEIKVEGKVEGDKASGSISGLPFPLGFEMTKESGDTPADDAAAKDDAEKKDDKPKKDEKLEPFRPILAGEAPLVVRCSNRDAAIAAVDAIAKQSKLRLVLTGASRELARKPVELPKLANGMRIGYLLGVEEVFWEEKGKRHNVAEILARQGFDVILVTRAQLGTRYLPVHAAWAVATGFDPRSALSSISASAGRSFGLGARIGRIGRGCDADLVLLSGDPFDLKTRILGVWVDGKLRVNRLPSEIQPSRGKKTGRGRKTAKLLPEESR